MMYNSKPTVLTITTGPNGADKSIHRVMITPLSNTKSINSQSILKHNLAIKPMT